LIIETNNNIEGEQTMNDQVKQESVENTATQTNAGVEVSTNQETENKVFTADQLEQIVQRRLDRYKKSVSNKLDGIDIEEAKKLLQEKKEKELEIAKQRGEFDKVLKETVSKKDSKIQSLETELKRIRIDETLVNVASGMKAVKPAEVKQLLRSNVRLNEARFC
jgi:lipid II:glycine glycyltransferase (peptidoglycan interpeptide bridge formation enzyme)